jgi:vacuolar-type H+-ATPase subunit F/Vma7
MTEHCADLIRSEVDEYMFSVRFPLIVEIPDRTGSAPGRPGIRELANAAIGISV